ncbi:hypothetical protein HJFPF1_02256 [Paramyrothecium foliicola]|nr:hypothetical protein HJFPF1_02256 [Paramyrothecium foliicola]
MSDYEVYCALCGGPYFSDWEIPEGQDDEDTYDLGIINPMNISELAWMTNARILGESVDEDGPEDEGCQTILQNNDFGQPENPALDFVQGAYDNIIPVYFFDEDMLAIPFHAACRHLLCRYLNISETDLESEALMNAFRDWDPSELDPPSSLDIDYGDNTYAQEFQWRMRRGDEYLVFNPVDVPGLKTFYSNLPLCSGSTTPRRLYGVNGDPFARLSPEILHQILSYLTDIENVFDARTASPAFANLALTTIFWKLRIRTDMPWLWDFPHPDPPEALNQIDWEKTFCRLWFGGNPRYHGIGKIQGLCNRRRIWVQLMPIFAKAYQQHLTTLQGWDVTAPIVLKDAHEREPKQLVHPKPLDDSWTTRTLLDRYSDFHPKPRAAYAMANTAINASAHSVIPPAKTDIVRFPDDDWLEGLIVTSCPRREDSGGISVRQVVGLDFLFAGQSPVKVGSNVGDKRCYEKLRNNFIVAMKMQGLASGCVSGLLLFEQPVALAEGCLRVVQQVSSTRNGHFYEYLWKDQLPPAGLNLAWGRRPDEPGGLFADVIDVSPMDMLIFANSPSGLEDITEVAVDIRLGGIEITYGHSPSRAFGPRRQAMRTLKLDRVRGERLVEFGFGMGYCVFVVRTSDDEARYLTVLASPDGQFHESKTTLVDSRVQLPMALYGFWNTSTRPLPFGVIAMGYTAFPTKRDDQGLAVPSPRDINRFNWHPSALPSEMVSTGPIWGPQHLNDDLPEHAFP